MKLSQQVCTLDQAKRLKELGVTAPSIFQHCKKVNRDWYVRMTPGIDTADLKEVYPAYTCAELGEMLPVECGVRCWESYYNDHQGDWYAFSLIWKEDADDPTIEFETDEAETEAEARAALLIVLLEKKRITPESISNE